LPPFIPHSKDVSLSNSQALVQMAKQGFVNGESVILNGA